MKKLGNSQSWIAFFDLASDYFEYKLRDENIHEL